MSVERLTASTDWHSVVSWETSSMTTATFNLATQDTVYNWHNASTSAPVHTSRQWSAWWDLATWRLPFSTAPSSSATIRNSYRFVRHVFTYLMLRFLFCVLLSLVLIQAVTSGGILGVYLIIGRQSEGSIIRGFVNQKWVPYSQRYLFNAIPDTIP